MIGSLLLESMTFSPKYGYGDVRIESLHRRLLSRLHHIEQRLRRCPCEHHGHWSRVISTISDKAVRDTYSTRGPLETRGQRTLCKKSGRGTRGLTTPPDAVHRTLLPTYSVVF